MEDTNLSKGEATRARILNAAFQLFIQKGYAATSIRDIADQVGLTVGGIYAHFENKETIWAAVFEDRHPYHQILPLLNDAQGETLDELVRDAARKMVHELEKREDIFNLMFIELVEFQGKHINSLALNILPGMAQLGLRLNQYAGTMRKISPPTLARAFLGTFFSFFVTHLFMPAFIRSHIDEEQALDEFTDIFLYGVLADDAPSRRKHA